MALVPSNTETDGKHYHSYMKNGGSKRKDYINMQENPGLSQKEANDKVAKENPLAEVEKAQAVLNAAAKRTAEDAKAN